MTTAGIAFVIPYRARPGESAADVITWCLRPLLRQLRVFDTLVVSDQGSPPSVVSELMDALAMHAGRAACAVLRLDPAPPPVWNIARARNRGFDCPRARAAVETEYVWPIDSDIRVPEGGVEAARTAMAAGAPGLAPLVRDHGNTIARTRPGSGIAILPAAMVSVVGGWDEAFTGYGSEDIDLFYRLGRRFSGWRCELWQSGPVFLHRPHAPQESKVYSQRANLERLRDKHGPVI